MIGLVIGRKAITRDHIFIDKDDLPVNIYWLTETPSPKQIGKVASWSSLEKIFDLSSNMSIEDCRKAITRMENVIPNEWTDQGINIKNQIFRTLNFKDQFIAPFSKGIESHLVDNIRLGKVISAEHRMITPQEGILLRNLTLPEKMNNTKIIRNPRVNGEGLYQVDIIKSPKDFNFPLLKNVWLTYPQLTAILEANCQCQLHECIKFVSQEDQLPLIEHEMLKPLLNACKEVEQTSHQHLEKIIIKALCNLPREQGIHPVSILLNGQLWGRNARETHSLINSGISVKSYSHNGIWCDLAN